jgi:hypothetical protein
MKRLILGLCVGLCVVLAASLAFAGPHHTKVATASAHAGGSVSNTAFATIGTGTVTGDGYDITLGKDAGTIFGIAFTTGTVPITLTATEVGGGASANASQGTRGGAAADGASNSTDIHNHVYQSVGSVGSFGAVTQAATSDVQTTNQASAGVSPYADLDLKINMNLGSGGGFPHP